MKALKALAVSLGTALRDLMRNENDKSVETGIAKINAFPMASPVRNREANHAPLGKVKKANREKSKRARKARKANR